MMAKKGIGKTHAKWSPVSTCIMRKQPVVTIDSDVLNKGLKNLEQKVEFVKSCPRNVFKMNLDRIDFRCLCCLDFEARWMMIDFL